MKYKIARSESPGRELKRVAGGEIKRARRALASKGDARTVVEGDVGKAVHAVRRSIKKVRGVLRLARRGLGRARFKRENGCFRDAGREIRAVRDAAAVMEALDSLTEHCFKGEPPAVSRELRRLLVADAQRLARGVASGRAFERTSRRLGSELKRVDQWELQDFTWKDARRAWHRACKACRRACEVARSEPTDENLHEWRKRAKDLWHEMLLLRKACPAVEKPLDDIGALTDILGDDRDLALLAKTARDREDSLDSPDQFRMLLGQISERRKKLQAKAFALADRRKA